jgi:DNA adenine methylase
MKRLRTPISYYGGKQKLASKILALIPKHKLYAEPFLGGAAIFFAKDASDIEVINDTNKELINFYQVCRNRYHDLSALVRVTLHSREEHDNAWIIYNKPRLFDEVRRAWAVWVLSTQSFASGLESSWGYDKNDNTTTKKISSKRDQFTEELAIRLQNAQIECADALYIIGSRDGKDSLFYCDPPYFNSDMGHYDGYSREDFEALLKKLSGIQGKFILSSYPSDLLEQYVQQFGWYQKSFVQEVSASGKVRGKMKTEVITTNYPI